MTDELDALLDNATFEVDDIDEKRGVAKLDPGFVIAMTTAVLAIQQDSPDTPVNALIYHTVKEFVKQTNGRLKPEAYIHLIFVHYLEVYRAYYAAEKVMDNPEVTPLDTQYLHLYNDAAVSIFDLYLAEPNNRVLRRLVPLAATALHDIVTAHQSANTEIDIKDLLGNVTSITLIASTIGSYVKGLRKRRNYPYIAWVKDLFTKAVATNDLSFMDTDPSIHIVCGQVAARKTIINIPS
jgi:hypothetical protein